VKVISVNKSKPTLISINGKEELTGYFKTQEIEPIFLSVDGVFGDYVADKIHHGGREKACYIYSHEHYAYWEPLPQTLDKSFGLFGENITVLGMEESKTHIGDIFKIGEAEVQISQPRQPCYKLGIRFGDASMVNTFRMGRHPGFYVRVIKEGWVKSGDPITIIQNNEKALTLTEVFELIYAKNPQSEILKKALDEPLLAPNVKTYLMNKHNSK
jgi:MOSC domain-containing protein YiiM